MRATVSPTAPTEGTAEATPLCSVAGGCLGRAAIFSNAAFGAGVTAMVLVLLGVTTWAGDGFWAVDGAYARFVTPIVMFVWLAVDSAFLMRSYSATTTSERTAVPAV